MGGRLEGRVALVTGGARGIGEGVARVFASEGARVAVTDVDSELGTRTAKDIGENACFVELDVASEDSWARAVDEVTAQLGTPTILVNNAGISQFLPLAAQPLVEYMRIITVNQVGTFLGMKAVTPGMADAGGGAIVNISSIFGLTGTAFLGAYTASKFAITGMTRVAAIELGAAGIRVNVIHPGGVNTPAVAATGSVDVAAAFARMAPLGRIGEPEEIGKAALFLASDDSAYVTGASLVVDGGMIAGQTFDFPT